MTKMDSYEASHGDIRQCGRPERTDQRQTSWQTRNERQGNEPGDPESDQVGSVDQWIRPGWMRDQCERSCASVSGPVM